MARWQTGAAHIETAIAQGELDIVMPLDTATQRLLADAERHILGAHDALARDPSGAFTLAYDAMRKAATAVLNHQGLRPTTRGGHVAVAEAIRAQFPGVPGLELLNAYRRRRNQVEYPTPAVDDISPAEAQDAIDTATAALDNARRLLDLDQLGIWQQ